MEVKPGYKQTDVGVIPAEWEVQTIGKAMKLVNGRAFKPEDWKPHGTPIIRIQNLNDPVAAFNYCDTPIEEKHRITSGDVLFAWSGTTGTSFGARIWNGPTGVLNQHIFRVIADPQKLTPVYSFLILQRVQEDIEKQAHGFKASFVHVKKSDLVKVSLPVPPLSEQCAIAESLSDVDELLGGLDRLIAKKRDLKQAALQQLLTGQTRLTGFRGEWQVKCIGELTDCSAGGTPSTLVRCYWGGSIRWMSSGELNLKRVEEVAGRITKEGLRNSSTTMIPPKCVLVGLAGQGKTRGTVAMNFVELCTNQSIAAIFPSPAFVPEYLYYNLDNRYDELRDLSSGDGGRGGLNLTLIKSLPVSLPPILEQSAIAEVLTDIDAEIAALEQRHAKTRALKQAMMQELLTGQTRLI